MRRLWVVLPVVLVLAALPERSAAAPGVAEHRLASVVERRGASYDAASTRLQRLQRRLVTGRTIEGQQRTICALVGGWRSVNSTARRLADGARDVRPEASVARRGRRVLISGTRDVRRASTVAESAHRAVCRVQGFGSRRRDLIRRVNRRMAALADRLDRGERRISTGRRLIARLEP